MFCIADHEWKSAYYFTRLGLAWLTSFDTFPILKKKAFRTTLSGNATAILVGAGLLGR